MTAPTPRIAVLLATYNGMPWLPEQMESILGQAGVSVRVLVLDDGSTDGTIEWIDDLASHDPRVTRLPSDGSSGSSAANFYRLIQRAPVEDDELVSFADQDDIWRRAKLARHAELLRAADGVSSNVTSFTADGRRTLIRKSDPQRRFDYLLQGPGPGSTFLMSPRLFSLAREVIATHPGLASAVDFHDSFVYAVARGRGWSWHIDPESTVDYRQHGDNVMGANVGMRSAVHRLNLIRTRWHRRQAIAMTEIALVVAPPEEQDALAGLLTLFTSRGIRSRLALVRLSPEFRRRRRDRWIIAGLVALGIW